MPDTPPVCGGKEEVRFDYLLIYDPVTIKIYDMNSPRPLSACALGGISYSGAPAQSPTDRLRIIGDEIVIDETRCFTPHALHGALIAVRAPGFFHRLEGRDRQLLRFALQVNEISTHSSAHPNALIDSLTGEILDVSPVTREFIGRANCKSISCPEEDLLQVEIAISKNALQDGERRINLIADHGACHPRLLFARGALEYRREAFALAKEHFHFAALLGHPDALECEWQATSALSRNFRGQYFETFREIQCGNPLGALTVLRAVRDTEPLFANAALAYCLRQAHEPEEGVAVCTAALQCDPHQADVYGHLSAYLTDLKRDREALQVAEAHLSHYPHNPSAYADALHSALLLGEVGRARWYALGYLTVATNLNTALKHLFSYFELAREWPVLSAYFDKIVPLLRAATPEVLALHGEILVELGEFPRAFEKLDLALRAAPGEANTVLAYARALARSGDESGAIRFMESVSADKNRVDDNADALLILSLLSELYRNTGELQKALALWPTGVARHQNMLAIGGPRPLVEFAYCCLANGAVAEARAINNLLRNEFSELIIVEELSTALSTRGR